MLALFMLLLMQSIYIINVYIDLNVWSGMDYIDIMLMTRMKKKKKANANWGVGWLVQIKRHHLNAKS